MSEAPILLVEDDFDIQDNLKYFLECKGYQVCSVFNGKEAFEFLSSHMPSLILLDLMMPVMDGYEFLEKFFSTDRTRFSEIPVIVISAAPNIEATAAEYHVSYVQKPFKLSELLDKINHARSSPGKSNHFFYQ